MSENIDLELSMANLENKRLRIALKTIANITEALIELPDIAIAKQARKIQACVENALLSRDAEDD